MTPAPHYLSLIHMLIVLFCTAGPVFAQPYQSPTDLVVTAALEVSGIPHIIVIEPGGYVVWEGFPLLHGHELTTVVIEQILSRREGNPDSRD